jgi:hypothetical protein
VNAQDPDSAAAPAPHDAGHEIGAANMPLLRGSATTPGSCVRFAGGCERRAGVIRLVDTKPAAGGIHSSSRRKWKARFGLSCGKIPRNPG